MNYSLYPDADDKRNFELPGSKPHYNPDLYGKVQHISLHLDLDIPRQSLSGICHITLTPIRHFTHLTLDAVDLHIQSVFVDNVSHPFDYDGKTLTLHLPSPPSLSQDLTITISYHKEKPQRGIYFISPDEYYPHKPTQVWTQGEDEDSRYWFPCFDFPGQLATSEIIVQVPPDYIAISNGELIKTEEKDGKTVYHWLQPQPHPPYLIALAVGKFAIIEEQWQDIPVVYYVEKGREKQAKISLGKTPRMIQFFSERYGYPYPYEKYAQTCVEDFIFGGMENTSATILTARCLLDEKASLDDRNTETLVAHELAHQWFGNLVAIKHWSHAWIKEGAASYAEVLWIEHEYGQQEGLYYLFQQAANYLEEDSSRYRRPIVTNVYREAIELYDRHLYEKGSCVYHMIRGILGEELFTKFLHTFVNDNAYKTVETVDLLRAIEKATGYNLAPLFEQYVFRGGHPDFKITYHWDNDTNIASVTVKQKQAREENGKPLHLFSLKIPLAFGYIQPDNKPQLKTFILKLEKPEQTFYFSLDKKPDFISFDVGNYHLKTVELDYGFAQLKAQLLYDPDIISRIYAARAIGKKNNIEAVNTLKEALAKETFWGVKVEIIDSLGKIRLNQATTVLISHMQDNNPRVRKAIVKALTQHKNISSYNTLKNIIVQGDESYFVEAEAISGIGKIVATGSLQDKQEEVISLLQSILIERDSWNEIIRSAAVRGLSYLNTNPKAADIISQYTSLGIPQPLRQTAIRCLGEVATAQTPDKITSILDTLESILPETFFFTQMSLIDALGKIEHPKAVSMLTDLLANATDGRVRRHGEETLLRLQEKLGKDKTLRQLQEEVEKLKQENQELQSRLALLETKNKQASMPVT